ncbi:MAG: M81 family metallopeptidase [Phycisphaeraceae bacterium]|nr:M81 family metallopeptidase [Phycisphaeraceae bacterium]
MARVGVIGIQHEANSFSSQPASIDQFKLALGQSMIQNGPGQHHEVAGMLEALADCGVETVPLMAAWAVPAGLITEKAHAWLHEVLKKSLQEAGALDGLLVAPHGAAVSVLTLDFDGQWLAQCRQVLGQRVPIVATLDLHANLSPKMVKTCDAVIAYRTNPHLDQYARGREAAKLMVATLRGDVLPATAAAYPRAILSMDRGCTDESPCQDLLAKVQEIQKRPHVLSASFLHGFAYSDVPEMGSSFCVVTDRRPDLAQQYADELAGVLLSMKDELVCRLPGTRDAVSDAAGREGTLCLLDVGDNVGGGAAGDGTYLLHELHRQQISQSFVSLYDPSAAAAAASAGVGATLDLSMGGHTDVLHGPPFVALVKVVRLHQGTFREDQPSHSGRSDYDMGPTAIVQTSNGITIQLTSKRVPPFSLRQITCCGLDPRSFRVLVAKGVNAPLAAYRPVCDHLIRVNTRGSTTVDLATLPYQHRRRPLFPFDSID